MQPTLFPWYRNTSLGEMMKSILASLLLLSSTCFAAAADAPSPVKVETMIQSTTSWDGTPYKAYPAGQPQITVLKYTIAAHTTMKWHTHPLPNAGYLLSGELTIEKKDGTKKHFVAGDALTETVDSVHRGITGDAPLVLVVFYAGTPGLPISVTVEDKEHP
jgi:quercetin dioxygenase-like cupin family protein